MTTRPRLAALGSRTAPGCRWTGLLLALLAACGPRGAHPAGAQTSAPAVPAKLVYGGVANFPPFEWLDEHGRPQGFHVELIGSIAAETGREIEIRLGRWSEIWNAFERGEIDVVGLFKHESRQDYVDFTVAHTVHASEIFIRRDGPALTDLASLSGHTVIVEKDALADQALQRMGAGAIRIQVASEAEALQRLASGVGDCAVVTQAGGRSAIFTHQLDNLTTTGPFVLISEVAFAVRKGNSELLAMLNEGILKTRSSDRYRELYAKWLANPGARGRSWGEFAALAGWIGGPLLAVAIGALLWSYTLRRSVAQRTRALARQLEQTRQAEERLRQSEERYRLLADSMEDFVTLADTERRVLYVSPSFHRATGYTADDLNRGDYRTRVHADDLAAVEAARADNLAGASTLLRYRYYTAQGGLLWLETRATPIFDAAGGVRQILCTTRDVTARRRVELALAESERLFRTLFEVAAVGMVVVDRDGRWTQLNQRMADILGYDREELRGRRFADFTHPDDRSANADLFERALRDEESRYALEKRYLRRDGNVVWVKLWAAAVPNPDGPAECFIAAIEDITEHKRIDELMQRERRIFTGGPAVAFRWRAAPGWPVEYVSENIAQYGYHPEDFTSGRVCYADIVHPDDLERVGAEVAEHSRAGRTNFEQEYRIRTADGAYRTLYDFTVVVRDAGGAITHYDGYVLDITERKKLEVQLRQAQKMEAIGQLAGGVAHDFNNLLTAILGFTELAARDAREQERILGCLNEIRRAAERASDLTRKLLAFARRQVIQPRVINLRDAAQSAEAMVRRLVGADIELKFSAAPDLWNVRLDPGQFDQILLNLAANARDAMPAGGTLAITLDNAAVSPDEAAPDSERMPGQFVCVEVRDTGGGIPVEHRPHLFEPFFTTKDDGRGTGLGLATVHGIVTQNGGRVEVDSTVGAGTAFRLYFPRAAAPLDAPAEPAPGAPPHGSETILLVEDQEQVRDATSRALQSLGYTVLAAGGSQAALRLAQDHDGVIDLLLTDVVMPGLSGPELSRQVRRIRPGIGVLFTSGFARDEIGARGVLDPDVSFLQKPYTRATLAEKVRQVIDAGHAADAPRVTFQAD